MVTPRMVKSVLAPLQALSDEMVGLQPEPEPESRFPAVRYCGFKIANCKEDKCQFWETTMMGTGCIFVAAGVALIEIAEHLRSHRTD